MSYLMVRLAAALTGVRSRAAHPRPRTGGDRMRQVMRSPHH
ncbi:MULTISPECIES: hypothetical protein [Streptomyces]|nr:hypothetical protein [Streptomyces sp. 2132.2]